MLSYKGNITRELVAKRTLLETVRQIDKRRREIDTSTAIFSISYEKISKKHKQRKKMSTKMKLLRSSERIMEEQLDDLLESAEMYIDTAMKNVCSRCGTTTAVAPSFATATTTHGADLPINLPPFSKRWMAIPPGRKQTPTDHSFGDERKRCEKRLIVEQIGRYDGSRFVPNFSGKPLFWTSKGTNLGSKTCCLLDYLYKRGFRDLGTVNAAMSSRLVESISLKLASEDNDNNEIISHIERQDINTSILLS
ncbi:hypothetical protein Pcinc_020663 [Petrolisthes cinctipes]|uniref:Uncharacterized protein n=1 Tax=Petrolisthes cinctipes TaxID=88211 RepID=A0AAE1FLZ5_PETCI|nr:hypothetical protein Pcinc_020663 [Petrolisthes cinctipes]